MAAIGILLTVWWYFIGLVGESSWRGKQSTAGVIVCALIASLICAFDSRLLISELMEMARSAAHFVLFDYIIYALAFVLLTGGLTSAALCAIAAFRSNTTKAR